MCLNYFKTANSSVREYDPSTRYYVFSFATRRQMALGVADLLWWQIVLR